MVELPQSYIIDKFNIYSSKVKESRYYLNGCCPVCREGKSWNVKTRLFYFLEDNYLFCHNCNRSWFPVSWVMEVANLSFKEVLEDLKDNNYSTDYSLVVDSVEKAVYEVPTLPGECVNLRDELQVKYFDNFPIVKTTLQYCKNRRLFSAINSPKTLFCCLNDKFHGNRLIIPFYNEKGKIESYISRKISDNDKKAKYLIKFGSKKPVFNLNKIDENFPYIFIFEGQIDSMFVKNGIAISGTHLTNEQEQEITNNFPFHQKIWVLDNYRFEEKEVVDIIINKLKNNEKVFLYEGIYSKTKDLNDFCVENKIDCIDPNDIINFSFSGEKGLLKLT
jgi:hypothetical protein